MKHTSFYEKKIKEENDKSFAVEIKLNINQI